MIGLQFNDDVVDYKISIIKRLEYQVKRLTQEKKSFEQLWHNSQRKIVALEKEISGYCRKIEDSASFVALNGEFIRKLKEMEEKLIDAEIRLGVQDYQLVVLRSEKLDLDTKLSRCEQNSIGNMPK